jgi:O-antigen ligase
VNSSVLTLRRWGCPGLLVATCMAAAASVTVEPTVVLAAAVSILLVGFAANAGPVAASVTLLWLYLVPLFAFGRSFSRIGMAPLQLPELLLVVAVAVSLPQWWPAYKAWVPRWFKGSTVAFAGLALLAVARGAAHGHPGAMRGLALVVYPALSGPIAAWIVVHPSQWRRVLTAAVAAAPLGLLSLSVVANGSVVAAAYAFYLSGLIGMAMTTDEPRLRRLLTVLALVGAFALAATGRRGPLLAVAVAFVVGLVVLTGYRPRHLLKVASASALSAVLVLCLVMFGAVRFSDLPGVGTVIERTQRGLDEAGSPEEANVGFRFAVWRYALSTVTTENPLFGVGFGRPFDLTFRQRDFGKEEFSGAHNSYVGVAYAAGFPAGMLLVAVFVGAARTCLRRPRTSTDRPVQLAWLASAVVISLTNVAAETTYIGGPLWILLGWLSVRQPSSRPETEPALMGTSG